MAEENTKEYVAKLSVDTKDSVTKINDVVKAMQTATKSFQTAGTNLNMAAKQMTVAANTMRAAGKEMRAFFAGMSKGASSMRTSTAAAAAAAGKVKKAVAGQTDAQKALTAAQAEYKRTLDAVNAAGGSGGIRLTPEEMKLKAIGEQIDSLKEVVALEQRQGKLSAAGDVKAASEMSAQIKSSAAEAEKAYDRVRAARMRAAMAVSGQAVSGKMDAETDRIVEAGRRIDVSARELAYQRQRASQEGAKNADDLAAAQTRYVKACEAGAKLTHDEARTKKLREASEAAVEAAKKPFAQLGQWIDTTTIAENVSSGMTEGILEAMNAMRSTVAKSGPLTEDARRARDEYKGLLKEREAMQRKFRMYMTADAETKYAYASGGGSLLSYMSEDSINRYLKLSEAIAKSRDNLVSLVAEQRTYNQTNKQTPEAKAQEKQDAAFTRTQARIDEYVRKIELYNARIKELGSQDVTRRTVREMNNLIRQTDRATDSVNGLKGSLRADIGSSLESVGRRMSDIGSRLFPTEQFQTAFNRVKELESAVADLDSQRRVMEQAGAGWTDDGYERVRIDLVAMNAELAKARNEMNSLISLGKAFQSGTETKQYEDMVNRRIELSRRMSDAADIVPDTDVEAIRRRMQEAEDATERVRRSARGTTGEYRSMGSAAKEFSRSFGKSVKDTFSVKSVKRFAKEVRKALHVDPSKSPIGKIPRIFGRIVSTMKRMLIYRGVSTVFNDTYQNMGLMAQASDEFNQSMSRVIDSTKLLGAQIAAIAEPIITTFGPYFSAFLDGLAESADRVSQFMARLVGSDTYMRAAKGQSDFAKSFDDTASGANKANKATKQLQATVLGFDELNKMNGVGEGIMSASFEKAMTDANAFNEIADRLHDAITSGDWKEFGRTMGDIANDAFGWLNDTAGWSKNADKFTSVLRGVIDSVNGFNEAFSGSDAGKAIADVANTFVESLKILTDPEAGIEFHEIGKNVGALLVNAVHDIEWRDLGIALVQSFQGAARYFTGVLSEQIVDEATGESMTIGRAIGLAISEMFHGSVDTVDPQTWGAVAYSILNNVTAAMADAFSRPEDFSELGRKFGESVNVALAGVNEDDFAASLTSWGRALTNFFVNAVKTIDWVLVKDTVIDTLTSSDLDASGLAAALGILALPSIIKGAFRAGVAGGSAILKSGWASVLGTNTASTLTGGLASVASSSMAILGQVGLIVAGLSVAVQSLNNVFTKQLPALRDSNKEMAQSLVDIYSQEAVKNAKFGFGGTTGAMLRTYFDKNLAIADKNKEYVSVAGGVMATQDFVDAVQDGAIEMDGTMHSVSESMKQLANELMMEGYAEGNIIQYGTSAKYAAEQTDSFVDNLKAAGAALDAFAQITNPLYMASRSVMRNVSGSDAGNAGDGTVTSSAYATGRDAATSPDGGGAVTMSNQKMMDSIKDSVYDASLAANMAVADRMATASSGDDVPIILQADGVEIARAVRRGNSKINRRGNHSVTFQ